MAETEKRYTHAYGQLRRLTSTIDGQIRQLSVSKSTDFFEPWRKLKSVRVEVKKEIFVKKTRLNRYH